MNVRHRERHEEAKAQEFRAHLLAWYDANARDLPWRQRPGEKRDRDPYRIWVSEIMLQQTRVAAVIAHYREFLRRFPTVEKLASAREASVLAAWSGLGYYRRARMLHAAAKVVVGKLAGKFPTTSDKWRELPGIGRYTAAAIASIAFGEAVAVVDGNVKRVLQRFSGERLADQKVWSAANSLLDQDRPGDFNQAMMELGATVCTPRAPGCLTCPIVELCVTRGELAGSPKPPGQRKRGICYALDYRDGAVFLVQRPRDARLMAGMWELPEFPSPAEAHLQSEKAAAPKRANQEQTPSAQATGNGDAPRLLFSLRHSITVTDYTVLVFLCPVPQNTAGKWIAIRTLPSLAMTGLARKILRKAGLLRDSHGNVSVAGTGNALPAEQPRKAPPLS